MGVGAVVSGIFGMNLKNALEDHPYAFILGKTSIERFDFRLSI